MPNSSKLRAHRRATASRARRIPRLLRAWNPMPEAEDFNSDDWVYNQYASANGHGNARAIRPPVMVGLANGGVIGGKRLLSEDLIADATSENIGMIWTG